MTAKNIVKAQIILCGVLSFCASAYAEEPAEVSQHRWLVLQLDAQGFDSSIDRFNEVLREAVESYVPEENTLLPKPQMELQSLAVAAGCKMRLQHCVLPIAKMIGAQTVVYGKMTGDKERGELTCFSRTSNHKNKVRLRR